MSRLDSLVEKKIREAMDEGEFDNLPGKGQPLDLRENPFEDPDLRMVHRLLRNAGFAPAWIEERKDIDAEWEKARLKLSRAWSLYGADGSVTDRQEWQRNLHEFREKVSELNQRSKIYSLKAPAAVFQRRLFDPDRAIREVQRERGIAGPQPTNNRDSTKE